MSFTVRVTKSAARQLLALPKPARAPVRDRIAGLAADPRPGGARKLESRYDLWRVRVGDYRIIYTVRERDLLVLVLRVGDRKRVYDRLSRLLPPDT